MDPLLVLFSVCGISVVCLGLIGVLAVLLLRFTGRNLFQGVGGLEGVVGALAGVGDDSGDDDYERLQRKSPQRRDLRAEAQSLDFQSTVEKYRTGQPGAQSARPAKPAPRPPVPSTNPFDSPPSLTDRRTTQRRRNQTGEDEDGLMGSFLDDGDGPLV
jgi:hypothetical protein